MNINIIDAVYCPKYNTIVSLDVCKFSARMNGVMCSYYKKERTRMDGIRELICSHGEKAENPQN